MDFQKIILDQLKGGVVDTIADKTGVDRSQAEQVIEAGLPTILAGLQKNTEDKSGAEALDKTLDKNHDGSLLDNLSQEVSSDTVQKDGNKALDHIFGGKLGTVKEAVADKAQINPKNALAILSILAPVILSQLGKQKKSEGLNASGLQEALQQQNVHDTGGILGTLNTLFDRNKDGSALDDVLSMGASFLNKK